MLIEMVASAQSPCTEAFGFAPLLEPDILVDGAKPEQRAVFSNISWEKYLAIDKERGKDCSVPRFYYLAGELEIMSTSEEHETRKKLLGDLLALYFEEAEIEVFPRGQATMWIELKKAGAEPDESWCIERTKKYPDLVVEIALSSGGIQKLEIYKRFEVPEVWIWRRKQIEVFVLDRSGEYKQQRSKFLPDLDLDLLQRCMALESWLEARRTFRAGLSKRSRSHER